MPSIRLPGTARRTPPDRPSVRAPSRRQLDRMRLVLDISRMRAVGDLDILLRRVVDASVALLGAQAARVYLYDPASDELTSRDPSGRAERIDASGAFFAVVLAGENAVRYREEDFGALPQPVKNAVAAALRDVDLTPLGVLMVSDRKRGDFTEEDAVLTELLAEQAAIGIQRFRSRQAAEQVAEMHREMEVVRAVQAGWIPREPPRLQDLETFGWTRSASLTGGDAFDVWALPEERLAAFVGDASGHGLPAALVIAQVRTLVRSLSEIDCEPEWLLSRVNTRLAQDLKEGGFVTAFFMTVSRGGVVRWSSAGQGPVFVCRSPESGYEALQAPAVPLGVSHELVADTTPSVTLEPGGLLVVASDGVLEARGPGEEMFGPARLLQLLTDNRGAAAREVAERVRDRLDEWQPKEEPADDQTVLVIRRTE